MTAPAKARGPQELFCECIRLLVSQVRRHQASGAGVGSVEQIRERAPH
jgi:hypothetical protein